MVLWHSLYLFKLTTAHTSHEYISIDGKKIKVIFKLYNKHFIAFNALATNIC